MVDRIAHEVRRKHCIFGPANHRHAEAGSFEFKPLGGIVPLVPLNSLLKLRLSGSAVACGVAVYNSIGNLGGFAGPYLIGAIKEATGSYGPSMMIIALGLIASAALVFLLGRIQRQHILP